MIRPRRFLFVWWDGGGNMPPALHLISNLVAKGHQVHVLGDPISERAFRRAGATFASFRRAPHREDTRPESDYIRDWEAQGAKHGIALMRERLLFGPALAFAEDTIEQIIKFRPDALAVMDLTFGALLAAEKTGIPTALIAPHILIYPVPGRPPFGPGLMPAQNVIQKARDRFISSISQREFEKGLPELNLARAKLGLTPIKCVFDPIRRVERILVLSSESLEFPGGPLPPNVRYTGPVLTDPSWTEPWDGCWPSGEANPLVLLSLGTTYQNQSKTLRNAIKALGALPVRGIVTTGPALNPKEFAAPENVVICPSIPHSQILPFTDAMITHGGHGSVVRALAHGVPLILIPMGRDQNDTAARVVYHGAGIRLSAEASVEVISQALERVLKSCSYCKAAKCLGHAIRRDAANSTAIEELEALAGMR